MDCQHENLEPIPTEDRKLCVDCGRKFCTHDWEYDYCCCALEAIIERRKEQEDV